MAKGLVRPGSGFCQRAGRRGGEESSRVWAQLRHSLVLPPWVRPSTFLSLTVPIYEVGRTGLPSCRGGEGYVRGGIART